MPFPLVLYPTIDRDPPCDLLSRWVFLKEENPPRSDPVGLAYKGKDIVFRFIIEKYSSLRDFYRPLGK